jgi:hypothetical protein
MLFKKITAVYIETYMKPISTECRVIVKLGGTTGLKRVNAVLI